MACRYIQILMLKYTKYGNYVRKREIIYFGFLCVICQFSWQYLLSQIRVLYCTEPFFVLVIISTPVIFVELILRSLNQRGARDEIMANSIAERSRGKKLF